MRKLLKGLLTLSVVILIFPGCSILGFGDRGGKTGGFVDRSNPLAPKTIKSKDIDLFEYKFFMHWPKQRYGRETIYSHCEFTIERKEDGAHCSGGAYNEWGDDSFDVEFVAPLSSLDRLHQILDRHKAAGWNGHHKQTIGIPEGLGGELYVRYVSGEKISVYDNAGPVMSGLGTAEIYDLFIDLALEYDPELLASGDKDWELYKFLHHRLETEDGMYALEFTHDKVSIYENGELAAQEEYVVVGDEAPFQIQYKRSNFPRFSWLEWEAGRLVVVIIGEDNLEFFPVS